MTAPDLVEADCPLHGPFEDIRAAVDQHGGWCPKCDGPVRGAQRRTVDIFDTVTVDKAALIAAHNALQRARRSATYAHRKVIDAVRAAEIADQECVAAEAALTAIMQTAFG
jgi:hypothetical protein